MTVYADTSFLVSLYLTDSHSAEARSRAPSAPDFWFTPLQQAEWSHAVAQHAFRRIISPNESDEMYDQLTKDRVGGIFQDAAIPENSIDLCADLARPYGPKLGMRTLGTLHLACALELKADRFWTFDERQAKLAKAQGLKS